MNISLKKPTREWVENRLERGGFSTASEYVRHLIREDQKRELERELIKGIESGPSRRMTKKDWEAIRRKGRRLATARNAK